MNMKKLVAILIAPILSVAATNAAVKRAPLSREIIAEAKASNKLILVTRQGTDATAVFENKHVARFVNDHFVVEQQSDRHTRNSFLIYNHNGELIHQVAYDPRPYELAVKIKRALNPQTQYYTLLSRFGAGERTADLLENLVVGATDADDTQNAPLLMQAYLTTLGTEPTDAQLRFIARHTARSTDPGFALLLENPAHTEKLAKLIFREEFTIHLNDKEVDAIALAKQAKIKYPAPALAQAIDQMSIELLEMREDWAALRSAVPAYVDRYYTQLSPELIGYYQWLAATYFNNIE